MINPLVKFRTFFLSLLAISSTIQGSPAQEAAPCCFSEAIVEFKTGYFFFLDSTMRKIYDKGGLDLQLSASYPLWNLAKRWSLNAYGAVEYFHRSGKSINGNQKTELWSVPVNIGLKPVYLINENLQYYLAAGPRYFYVHQHNSSYYVPKNSSRNGLGLFVNTGFNYVPCDHFVVDLFGEYSYARVHFHTGDSRVYTSSIQMGGFTFGGGLGYSF